MLPSPPHTQMHIVVWPVFNLPFTDVRENISQLWLSLVISLGIFRKAFKWLFAFHIVFLDMEARGICRNKYSSDILFLWVQSQCSLRMREGSFSELFPVSVELLPLFYPWQPHMLRDGILPNLLHNTSSEKSTRIIVSHLLFAENIFLIETICFFL